MPENTRYIRIVFQKKDTTSNFTAQEFFNLKSAKIQLEEGTEETEYLEYRNDNFDIFLDEPLRSIGDTSDYIDFLTHKVVRNIKTQILTGDEHWDTYDANVNGNYCYWMLANEDNPRNYKHSWCSNFSFGKTAWAYGGVGKYSDHPVYNRYYFVTDKATLSDWKEWLNDNNVRLDFILSNPVKQDIDLPIIELQQGKNKLTINTEVSPCKIEAMYYIK